MNILGVIAADVSGHPAACLLRDGRLVALAEEERFVRVKQARGYFPGRAIAYCLEEGGLDLADIDRIAYGWAADRYRWRFPLFLARSFLAERVGRLGRAPRRVGRSGAARLGTAWIGGLRSLLGYQPRAITEKLVLGLREVGYDPSSLPALEFFRHHRCHAATAFFCSGFEESAVLVFDGHGEENAVTIYRGEGTRLELLQEINIPHSLGWFYCAFTEYLGFNPNEGEVKLMGLAPYGCEDPALRNAMEDVLALTPDGIALDSDYIFYGPRSQGGFFSDQLVDRFGPTRRPGEALTDRHREIAFAVQRRLEQAGLHLARRALELAGSRNLCLAGGVALNCKMNGAIHASGIAEHLFVQPISHDAGASLGAAMLAGVEAGDDPREKLDHLHWGPGFDDDEIEASLRRNQITFRRSRDVARVGARMIAEGKIIGWFQGRMEAGPRALGGRSILADPRDAAARDRINDRVKFREPWRPFAMSLLEEHAERYLSRPDAAPFMIVAFEVPEDARGDIEAAMHPGDDTTRPQIVSRENQSLFWRLIESFREITGVPAVLNTSFNVRGEPIVCTPDDAIRCFFGTGLDALLIGPFVVEK